MSEKTKTKLVAAKVDEEEHKRFHDAAKARGTNVQAYILASLRRLASRVERQTKGAK